MAATVSSKAQLLEWVRRMSDGYFLDVAGTYEEMFPATGEDAKYTARARGVNFFNENGFLVSLDKDPPSFRVKSSWNQFTLQRIAQI